MPIQCIHPTRHQHHQKLWFFFFQTTEAGAKEDKKNYRMGQNPYATLAYYPKDKGNRKTKKECVGGGGGEGGCKRWTEREREREIKWNKARKLEMLFKDQ